MERLNTIVRCDGDRAEAWAGSQFQTVDHAAIAEVLGLKPSVRTHPGSTALSNTPLCRYVR
jgi:isoquinoline 1-oxidoreductase subunit beta